MRSVAVALLIAITGCASGGKGTSAPAAATLENTPFNPTLEVDFSKMTRLPSGMYYKDLEIGRGPVVLPRNEVRVHYTGWLSNGTRFDQNKESDEPIAILLGRGAAIQGWDNGVPGMRVGGRRQLVIPPSLGYGSNRRGAIPADAVLVFVLTVVSAK